MRASLPHNESMFSLSELPLFASDTLGEAWAWVWPVAVAVAVAAASWRMRSTHFFLLRTWRMMFGQRFGADREVDELLQAREGLIKFRFFFGLPVRTLDQAKQVGAWAKANGEELGDVRACGNLFDLETCDLKRDAIPSMGMQVLKLVSMCLLVAIMASTALMAVRSAALLQFKASGTWFWLDGSSAQTVAPWRSGRIDRQACSATAALASSQDGFSDSERTSLCGFFADPELDAFVQATVKRQRAMLAFILAYLMWPAVYLWNSVRRGAAARRMQQRLLDRAGRTAAQCGATTAAQPPRAHGTSALDSADARR